MDGISLRICCCSLVVVVVDDGSVVDGENFVVVAVFMRISCSGFRYTDDVYVINSKDFLN